MTDAELAEVRYGGAPSALLPMPWRGFMLTGFAAAYMSTVGTLLNSALVASQTSRQDA
jgi:hypothetical protein